MALNPVETLNVFSSALRKELRDRSKTSNLITTRAPFLRFTTAANMADLANVDYANLGPVFSEYSGYKFFTLGVHGYENTNYATSDLYGTQLNKGLIVGTTYKPGEQKLVRTHGGDQGGLFVPDHPDVVAGKTGAYVTYPSPPTPARNYPPPGITSAKVERTRNGNVLKFVIETQCYTQEQLQVLDALCFVPGMSCILEWGTQITRPDGTSVSINKLDFTSQTIDVDLTAGRVLSRKQFIETYCEPNKFNYDWGLANISNVKTVIDGNVYKTTITAFGVADNLMYISAYATSNPLEQGKIDKERSQSINDFFKSNGQFTSILTDAVTSDPDRIVKFIDNYDRKELEEALPASAETGNLNDTGLEDTFFMRFDYFIDVIVNQHLLQILNSAFCVGYQQQYFFAPLTLNIENPGAEDADTIFVGYNPELRSTSPETVLIYNKTAIDAQKDTTDSKNEQSKLVNAISTEKARKLGQVKNADPILEKLKVKQFIPLNTTDAGISGTAPLFSGVWINSKAIQAAFLNARTIMEGVETLLRNINAATEGYWELKLFYDDDVPAFRILDDNLRDPKIPQGEKIYEFNKRLIEVNSQDLIGPEVLDIQIATDFPKLLFSQLAVSGINGGTLASSPDRKNMDFKIKTSVRDILARDEKPVTADAPAAQNPTPALTVGQFVNNIFGQGSTLDYLSPDKTFIQSALNERFSDRLPPEVGSLLTDLFRRRELLTRAEGDSFAKRVSELKSKRIITEDQFNSLVSVFAIRSRAIVTRKKNEEIKQWNDSLDAAKISKTKSDYIPLFDSARELVENKIKESKDELLKKIDEQSKVAAEATTTKPGEAANR